MTHVSKFIAANPKAYKAAAAVIAKLLPDGMDVSLRSAGSALHIQAEGVEIHATLLEGGFPGIQGTMDAARRFEPFLIDTETLSRTLKRAMVMVDAEHAACVLAFALGSLTVSVGNMDLGTFSETIPVDWKLGDVEIALNPRYLLDAIGACTTDKIEVRVKDAASPLMLRDTGDGPVEAIVMPVRI
jgi:DNA polymerase-3 subunit beta